MKTILKILLITTTVHAAPTPNEKEEVQLHNRNDLDEYGHYFEGDMILNDQQADNVFRSTFGLNTRNGLVDEKYRWPYKTLFYELSKDFDTEHVQAIEEALKTIESKTCIRFMKTSVSPSKDYVYVTGYPVGCYAEIGHQGGKQLLNLQLNQVGLGCFKMGSIMHEFIHALGFFHQQSSPDRDKFVEIHYDNIVDGHEDNFQKYPPSELTEFGIEYDYDSIMHYASKAFSKNGMPTMTPIHKAEIGQRTHLSLGDINKLNIMYKC